MITIKSEEKQRCGSYKKLTLLSWKYIGMVWIMVNIDNTEKYLQELF